MCVFTYRGVGCAITRSVMPELAHPVPGETMGAGWGPAAKPQIPTRGLAFAHVRQRLSVSDHCTAGPAHLLEGVDLIRELVSAAAGAPARAAPAAGARHHAAHVFNAQRTDLAYHLAVAGVTAALVVPAAGERRHVRCLRAVRAAGAQRGGQHVGDAAAARSGRISTCQPQGSDKAGGKRSAAALCAAGGREGAESRSVCCSLLHGMAEWRGTKRLLAPLGVHVRNRKASLSTRTRGGAKV